MLARVGGFIHRYAITGLYTCLGLLNAQSWPYLLVFIAFGAAIDIWLVKPSVPQPPKAFELLTEEELRREHAKCYKLLPLFFGFQLLGIVFLFTIGAISRESPAALVTIGPNIYELTAPFTSLLRNHYQDLVAHDLAERAAVVAVTYAGTFGIFYIGLGVWLAAIRNMALGWHPRARGYSKWQKLNLAFMLLLFPTLVLFLIYLTTWADIDYVDETFGRRHINLNIAKYDDFFWHLAVSLGCIGLFAPVLYLFLRTAPLIFSRRRD